jgi:hypothetical protein
MAAAVADVFADGGVLLAEAGTGTGKTLAYLVPRSSAASACSISTGTKNLQEQIFFKDLPVLRDTLGIPFTAAYMKGRGNYLCLHRFDALKDARAIRSREDAIAIEVIDEWSRRPRPAIAPRWRTCRRTSAVARHRGDERELHRRRLPALQRLLRDEDAPARRRVRRGDRQPPPALRRRVGAAERVRRGHSRRAATRSSTRRTSSRTSRRSTSARGQQLPVRRLRPRRRSRASRTADPDRDASDALRDDIDNVRDGARLFFGTLQMLRFEAARRRREPRSASPRRCSKRAARRRALVRALEAVEGDDRARPRTRPRDVLALGRRAASCATTCASSRTPRIRGTSSISTSAAAASSCAPLPSTSPTSSARCCSSG